MNPSSYYFVSLSVHSSKVFLICSFESLPFSEILAAFIVFCAYEKMQQTISIPVPVCILSTLRLLKSGGLQSPDLTEAEEEDLKIILIGVCVVYILDLVENVWNFKYSQIPRMHCYAFNLQPAAGYLNYSESSHLSIIRQQDFEPGNTRAL